MNLSRRTWAKIYDAVHTALWVLLAAWVAIILVSIPRMQDARATIERERAQQISEENTFFCEKWGLQVKTHEHVICTMDLNDIRARVEQRLADDAIQ